MAYSKEGYLKYRETHIKLVLDYQKRNPEKARAWRRKYGAKKRDERIAAGWSPTNQYTAKLDETAVRDIYSRTKSCQEYMSLYNVCPSSIYDVWKENCHKHIIEKIKAERLVE